MSKQNIPDITVRDPFDYFTDREEILELFEQSLHSAKPGKLQLLELKGNIGTGKTFLISYLIKRVCPKLNWQTGLVSFNQSGVPDFRFILMGMEDALKGCVLRESLKQYREKREEYNRSFDKYQAVISVQQNANASDHSTITGLDQNININAQLREREVQLRSELSRALVELAEESQRPLCLFIDGYERLAETNSELAGWLLGEILPHLVRAAPQPLQIVICGWEYPSDAALSPFIRRTELNDFDLEQMTSYLEKQRVFNSIPDRSSPEYKDLLNAFYKLTNGHPLVLALAVTYIEQLDNSKLTANTLRFNTPPIDNFARIEFLEKRLLERLPEPYRTLLERGPILRYFDQNTLQALLDIDTEGATHAEALDDRKYIRFLNYPFIKQQSGTGTDFSFHSLVRRVRLAALRLHSQTKEQLHLKMMVYYAEIVQNAEQSDLIDVNSTFKNLARSSTFQNDFSEWLLGTPEKTFRSQLEFLYHGLQVSEHQAEILKAWELLFDQAVSKWQKRQAGLLLEVIQQLVDEREPFLDQNEDAYNQYLFHYSRFLMQEFRWDEAQSTLEKAAKYFERVGKTSMLIGCLNGIGVICLGRGNLSDGINYLERSLALSEQAADDPYERAAILNNLGAYYRFQGKLDQSLNSLKRALNLLEKIQNPASIASIYNNIAETYKDLGDFDQSLIYLERALSIMEKNKDLLGTAVVLNNIGRTYGEHGKLELALDYLLRSLALREQIDNPAALATALNNIGEFYYWLEDAGQALSYLERSLILKKKVGNPAETAITLNNFGYIYAAQGKLKEALDYHKQALVLKEQVGNPSETAISHSNIGDVYLKQGKLNLAIERYSEALRIYKNLGRGFEAKYASELASLAVCYLQLGDLEKAATYGMQAKRIREKINPPFNRA